MANKFIIKITKSRYGRLYVVLIFSLLILAVTLAIPILTPYSQKADTPITPQDNPSTVKEPVKDKVKTQPTEKELEAPKNEEITPLDTSQKPPKTPASKAGCNYYDDFPYQTITKPDSSLKEGASREIGGIKGWRKECTNDSGKVISNEITSEPYDKIIYYGTFTYEDALSKARMICNQKVPAGSQNSTFFGDCIERELANIW